MNVSANSNSTPIAVPEVNREVVPVSVKTSPMQESVDTFEAATAAAMLDTLRAGPPIRPDELAHARQLAANPNYPSRAELERLAAMFVNDAFRS